MTEPSNFQVQIEELLKLLHKSDEQRAKLERELTDLQLEKAGLLNMFHFLMIEGKCPVIHDGKLAYVGCRGVSRDAFEQAIKLKTVSNLSNMVSDYPQQ